MKIAILSVFIATTFFGHSAAAGKMHHVNSSRDTVIVKVSKKDSTLNDGSSFDKAIYIIEEHETPGIHAEYEWIKNKYPGYKNRGQSLSYHDQKPFDIIHITTADGKQTDIYFDISKFFGKF